MKLNPVLRQKVINSAIRSLRRNKRVERISLVQIANELNVSLEDLQNYYISVEDIFLKAQKKDWESLHRYWDGHIKKAKTPGDYKNAFDLFLERFTDSLSDDADIRLEMSCYLPTCIKYREQNMTKLRKKFYRIINKGWPGKSDNVLERQTEIILILLYGFIDHIAHIPRQERSKILQDFRNMLNLHLQDRKFF